MTWPSAALRELITEPLANGRSVKDQPGGFPVLRLTALRNGTIDLQQRKEGAWSRADAERFLVRAGDFLVCRGNGSLDLVGRGGLVAVDPDEVAFPDTMIRVRPNATRVVPRFLALAWSSPIIRRQIESCARTTAGIYKVNHTDLGAIAVPLPPVEEQGHIVDLLEDHLSRLDAAENYLTSGLRRAEVWHQRLLANTLWSADYPRARVGDLLRESMRNGRSDRAAAGDETGTRTLTLTAVTKNAFTEVNTKISVTAPDRARDLWLEPGDVFVQRSNTPELVGTTARYDGPREWAIFPDLLIRLRADEDKIDSRFLAVALQSKPGHDQLRRKAKGLAGSMPKIDQSAIAATTIPLPPVDVQQQLLAIIEDAANALALLRAELSSAQRRSGVLRRALFEAAFSGRLTGAGSDPSPAEEMINV